MREDNKRIKVKKIKEIPEINKKSLNEITKRLSNKIDFRKIMYSDIINYILRNGFMEKSFTDLIIWCNYKIRCGETFINLDNIL